MLLGTRVSEEVLRASWNLAAGASATASLACVSTWYEDFRQDLSRVDVSTLVIHGDSDRIVPIEASGRRTATLIKGAQLVVVRGGPHCITWTHAEEVTSALLSFFGCATCRFLTAAIRRRSMHSLGWRTVTARCLCVIRRTFDGSDDLDEALPALPFHVNEFQPEFVSMRPLHVRSRDIERMIMPRHGNQEADTLTLL